MSLAYLACQTLYEARGSIVDGMTESKIAYAEGLLFAVIPKRLLPPGLATFQRRARDIGVDLEFELLRIVGEVPPHFHRRSGGVIIKCHGTSISTEGILDPLNKYPNIPWMLLKPGEFKFVPAGMVHGLRYTDSAFWRERFDAYGLDEVAHFLSVNTPPIKADDVTYV